MIAQELQERIRENWQQVQADVAAAAQQSGREPASVAIVGVSKYVDAETTAALFDAGCPILGENRPQALWQKAEHFQQRKLADPQVGLPSWHLIGHMQRNKTKRTIPLVDLIHSVDSLRLLQAIAEQAERLEHDVAVLIEVNVSDESNKTGLAPSDAESVLMESLKWQPIQVRGLMAMAGWGTDTDVARRQFAKLRALRDRFRASSGLPLPELSMGMSGDYREAIAEGATIVRIGSRLFEGVPRV